MSAGGSNNKASLGAIGQRTPDQTCSLRFGARSQGGFLALPSQSQPARLFERLPDCHSRHEIHENHFAARRGLSLSVHGLNIGQRQSSVTLQAKGYAQ